MKDPLITHLVEPLAAMGSGPPMPDPAIANDPIVRALGKPPAPTPPAPAKAALPPGFEVIRYVPRSALFRPGVCPDCGVELFAAPASREYVCGRCGYRVTHAAALAAWMYDRT